MIQIEVLVSLGLKDGWCEGAKGLAAFYLGVDFVPHTLDARVGEYRTRAERAWAELHPAMKPAHNLSLAELMNDGRNEIRLFPAAVRCFQAHRAE